MNARSNSEELPETVFDYSPITEIISNEYVVCQFLYYYAHQTSCFFTFSFFISPKRIFYFQHQAVEPGHNGGFGVRAAKPVEEDHKRERVPAARHHRAARATAPTHGFVGL